MGKCKKIKNKILILLLAIVLIAFYYLLPITLFNDTLSTVVYDRNGELLGAKIAEDEQWRFPVCDSVPFKFKEAVIEFEDRHFYYHPGINPFSIARAFIQNIKAGEIVSGGSTLTMQLIRLAGKGRPRTYTEKLKEIILALRLELSYSKEKILSLYSSNAPFGGNVIGLDAAAWRYFGRNAHELSWAEAATLAVLPNAPSLIHPGKNRELLLDKRNRLIDRLYEKGKIDSITCYLSKLELLPEKPHAIPQLAPHLLTRIYNNKKGSSISSTIDARMQQKVAEIVKNHNDVLKHNQIHNIAVIVAEVETGDVIAYIGNTKGTGHEEHGNMVDVCIAPRSTGSILKPFLFAAMLDDGMILQNTLVPDIPTYIAGYTPKNFNLGYEGAVPAKKALARSLNIPSVRMLRNYGVERFHYLLRKLGFSTINYPPDHYGLTLILGGAEATLWALAGVYTSMARTLNHFQAYNSKYFEKNFRQINYDLRKSVSYSPEYKELSDNSLISAGAIWLTYNALLEVNRPEEETGWKYFSSSQKVAWKTGTSFGFRDAWAIGTTPAYVVAVWVGNADGEGRPGLTGVSAAAPVMFDVFDLLPRSDWFDRPFDEMIKVPVCRQSGHRASLICDPVDSVWILEKGLITPACPYHQIVHLDKNEKFRVSGECEDVNNMVHKTWFVLPPVQEWYYKSGNPLYKPLPPARKACLSNEDMRKLAFIYPDNNSRIFIPVEMDGTPGKVVFEIAHRDPQSKIYWHLDEEYIGFTENFHQMGMKPEKGKHIVTVVDGSGSEAVVKFEIVNN